MSRRNHLVSDWNQLLSLVSGEDHSVSVVSLHRLELLVSAQCQPVSVQCQLVSAQHQHALVVSSQHHLALAMSS